MENYKGVDEIDDKTMRITSFFFSPSQRCCAPIAEILLLLRSSVVSACMKIGDEYMR